MKLHLDISASTTSRARVGLLILGLIACGATESLGQVNHGRNSYTTPAASYFGSQQVGHPQMATPQQTAAARSVQLTGSKPFQNVQLGTTLSPYLSLDMPETSTSLPNYYAYVRPQLQQREMNEAQSEEIRRLRQQVRMRGGQVNVSKNPNEGLPTTGTSSQFMNLGNYFPGTGR